MATINLGQVGIVNKGAWSSAASYDILNTVYHNGGTFMAIAPNSNKEPGVAAGWSSYWVSTALGIKLISATAVDASTAQLTVTFSDGTTATGGTFNTAVVANGSITTAKLDSTSGSEAVATSVIRNGAVTTAKLDSTSGSEAVDTSVIRDGAVTAAKISNYEITAEKLADNIPITKFPTFRRLTLNGTTDVKIAGLIGSCAAIFLAGNNGGAYAALLTVTNATVLATNLCSMSGFTITQFNIAGGHGIQIHLNSSGGTSAEGYLFRFDNVFDVYTD